MFNLSHLAQLHRVDEADKLTISWAASLKLLVVLATLLLPALASASGGVEPEGFREFAAQFRSGHEAGDFGKISELICWDRVDAKTRETVELHTASEFGRPISSILFEQLPEDALLEYELGGVTYRPNLPPIGYLVVQYPPKPSNAAAATDTRYLVGRKAGNLRVTTAAPAVTRQRR